MGQMFKVPFEKEGIKVIISGRTTSITNKEAASQGDIVIVTVPINKTVETIEEIAPFVKNNAMFTDFTSVKVNPVKAMKNSNAEIVGGHPLFGPTSDFKGQHFILSKESKGDYYEWYKFFIEKLGMKVIEMSAENHDKNMAVIQCLTHFSSISLGHTLNKMGYDLEMGQKISTPVYLMRLYGVGRILAQDAELYSDIQMLNPYAKEVSQKYFEATQELNNAVKTFNDKVFTDIFNESKNYFGELTDKSMKVTDKLIKEMKNEEK